MPDDPNYALYMGSSALGALSDVLLHAAGSGRGDLHLVDPEGLSCLLDCIRAQIEVARDGFKGWKPV